LSESDIKLYDFGRNGFKILPETIPFNKEMMTVGWIMNAAQYKLKRDLQRNIVHVEVFDNQDGSILSKASKIRMGNDGIECSPVRLINGIEQCTPWRTVKLAVYTW
jgi:hypothetical protein